MEEPKVHVSMPEVSRAAATAARYLSGTGPSRPHTGAEKPADVQVYLDPDYKPRTRSRVTYALLGFFLGCFGAHNFYAGHTRRAVFQLCLTFFSFFYLALVSWVWALVEICAVKTDGDGLAFN